VRGKNSLTWPDCQDTVPTMKITTDKTLVPFPGALDNEPRKAAVGEAEPAAFGDASAEREPVALARYSERSTGRRVWLYEDRLCYLGETIPRKTQYREYTALIVYFLDNGKRKEVDRDHFREYAVPAPVPTDDDLREAVHSWLDYESNKDATMATRLVNAPCHYVSETVKASRRHFLGYTEEQIRNHVASWQDAKRQPVAA